jgi:integrase
MAVASEIDRRNRALIGFALLTGALDSAIASMKLKHVDTANDTVFHDAREVRTKFSKTFTTCFFPVGEDVEAIVSDWIDHLHMEKLWSLDDPLSPATHIAIGVDQQFEVSGLERRRWTNTTPIRRIFASASAGAGLPYFNPHSFRKTLAQFGQRLCRTPEDLKAWSQNLGHEGVLTTLTSYGKVAPPRQAEIIRNLAPSNALNAEAEALLLRFLQAAIRTNP